MKRLLLLLPLLTLLFASGCSSTAEHNALVAIGTVGTTADAAIGAYSEYLLNHQVPVSQVLEVRKAVQAYVAAVDTAKTAVTAYKSGTSDKATLDQAIDTLSASSANIVRLIQTITNP